MLNRWRARPQAKVTGSQGPHRWAMGLTAADSPGLGQDTLPRPRVQLGRASATAALSASFTSTVSSPSRLKARQRGRLTASDALNPYRFGRFKDDYRLTRVAVGAQVVLKLKSRQFDAYLQVFDRRSRALLFQNDDTETGTNSRLAFTVQPGIDYGVRVTSYGIGQTGRYRIIRRRRQPSIGDFSFTYGYGLIDAAAAIAQLQGSAAAPPATVPNWSLNAVGSPAARDQGFSGQGQVVAVIDTGVDLRHPDLRGSLWQNQGEIPNNGRDDDGNGFVDDRLGWDFVRGNPRPQDQDGHGTHVAGIIAAQDNGIGTTGVAPQAKIMPIRVLGRRGTDSDTLARGIRYAVDNGADVINLSLGAIPGTGVSPAVKRSLRLARRQGVSVVIAAGNERLSLGATQPGEPAYWAATHRLGLAVGAIDAAYRTADFSNPTGTRRPNWFVVAPGVSIASTYRGGGTALLSGTSMAAPHVAGAIALVKSARPRAKPGQIARALIQTASPVVGA